MPRNTAGKPIDPTDCNRNDGFSPGSQIVTQVPGPRHAAGLRNDRRRAEHRHRRAPTTAHAPVVVIDADTRPAPARSGPSSTRTPPTPPTRTLLIRPAKNLARGPPLHRRPARPAATPTATTIPAQQRVPRLPRRPAAAEPGVEARRAHIEQIFTHARQAGIERRDLYLAWDFTVASERSLAGAHARTSATTPSPSSATTTSRDLKVQGSAPAVHRHRGHRPTCAARARGDGCQRAATDDQIARDRQGHDDRALLPRHAGLPAGLALQLRAGGSDGSRSRSPATSTKATSSASSRAPRSTAPARAPARPSLYGHGLLRQRSARSTGRQRPGDGQRAQLHLLRHRLVGMADEDVPNVADDPRTTSRTSRRSPTASSRGCSTSSTSGALLIHPHGLSQPTRRFQDRTASADRHPPPLLRRQQPGRHHRRRADRGRARLQPRRARRARA